MSIRIRYWTHYGYFVLLLLLTATVSILTLRTLGQAIEQVFHQDFQSTLAGREMMAAIDREDALVLKAMYRQADARQVILELEAARKAFMDALGRARVGEQAETLRRIRQLFASYQASVDAMASAPGTSSDRYMSELEPHSRSLREAIAAMIVANQRGLKASAEKTRSLVRVRTFLMSLVCALGLLSLFLMSRRFDTHVIDPLRRVRDTVVAMANGDDARRPPPLEEGEIGDIARAVTRLADRFEAGMAARQADMETCRRTLRALIDLLPEPAVLLSPAGAMVAFNQAFSRRVEHVQGSAVQAWLADTDRWETLELPQGQGTLHRARS